MKILGMLLIVGALGTWVFFGMKAFEANQSYTNEIGNYWTLADRASTIQQKSDYIDKFVNALSSAGLTGQYDALIYKTQENLFDTNFEALKSLQTRLHAIKGMDENSFAYQTAIQQITAQEQGQAGDMISLFHNVWDKVHYNYFWNVWVLYGLIWLLPLIVGGVGVMLLNSDSDY